VRALVHCFLCCCPGSRLNAGQNPVQGAPPYLVLDGRLASWLSSAALVGGDDAGGGAGEGAAPAAA
jgi:hypothetical protein